MLKPTNKTLKPLSHVRIYSPVFAQSLHMQLAFGTQVKSFSCVPPKCHLVGASPLFQLVPLHSDSAAQPTFQLCYDTSKLS